MTPYLRMIARNAAMAATRKDSAEADDEESSSESSAARSMQRRNRNMARTDAEQEPAPAGNARWDSAKQTRNG